MTLAFPVVVPDWLIDTYTIDLAAKSGSKCDVRPQGVAFSAAGDMYVMYSVWRWGADDWRNETDPALRNLHCQLIARYDRRGHILGILMGAVADPDGVASRIVYANWRSLCALPDGNIAVTHSGDRTYVISADLGLVLAEYPPVGDTSIPGVTDPSGFASCIRVTPGGRLLCTVDERCLDRHGFNVGATNLVAIGDAAPLSVTRPILEVIAAVGGPDIRTDMDNDEHRLHISYRGAPLTMHHRPQESLVEQLLHFDQTREEVAKYWRVPYLMGLLEPLADDLFVVPLFSPTLRSGSTGQPFAFCLLDDMGQLVGTLRGMNVRADSPYNGGHFRVATDPPRGRVFHLNSNGLYAWSGGDGALRAKLPTTETPYSQLKQFELWGCSPDGEIVLTHRKQNVVLRIPAPDHLDELNQVVADALATYAKERAALKKALAPVDWFWTHAARPGELHWL